MTSPTRRSRRRPRVPARSITRAADYRDAADETYRVDPVGQHGGVGHGDQRPLRHRPSHRSPDPRCGRPGRRTARHARRCAAANAPAALDRADERLDTAQRRLLVRSTAGLERASGRLDVITARVAAVDPAVQLARGWSITRRADGTVVRSIADLAGRRRRHDGPRRWPRHQHRDRNVAARDPTDSPNPDSPNSDSRE